MARIDASENQTVDSRYDPRSCPPTFLDFPFGNRIYRGGLFVGNALDPSRVGRSFLKFQLPELPVRDHFWAGSVNLYHTRSFADGSVEVGCQALADVSWNAATLKWTTAPALDPAAATARQLVTYDSANPTRTWVAWGMSAETYQAMTGLGLLSLGLASTNENANGWVYFAKKEWDPAYAPCILYAYEPNTAPLAPADLTATAQSGPRIVLSWTNTDPDTDRIRIERRVGNTAFTELATIDGTSSYSDTTVSSGTMYTYRVRALKNCRASRYSNEASAIGP